MSSPFPSSLTRDTLLASLADDFPDEQERTEVLDGKLKAAAGSPTMLIRSFVAAYHHDMLSVRGHADFYGGATLLSVGFGDAHPDNFGAIRFNKEAKYVFNDMDDCGTVSVGADAVRYFAVLRLMLPSGRLFDRLWEEAVRIYASLEFQSDAAEIYTARALELNTENSWEKNAAKQVKKATSKGTPIDDASDQPPETLVSDLAARRQALGDTANNWKAKHLSFVDIERSKGGSGGMRRTCIINSKLDVVIELKQLPRHPGSWYGMTDAEHQQRAPCSITDVEQALWGFAPAYDSYVVQWGDNGSFFVRDRSVRQSVGLGDLLDAAQADGITGEAQETAMQHIESLVFAQTYVLMRVHRGGWLQEAEARGLDARAAQAKLASFLLAWSGPSGPVVARWKALSESLSPPSA